MPAKAVSIAQTSNGHYLVLDSDGGVFSFVSYPYVPSQAGFYGSLPGRGVTGVTPVQIVATSDTEGYWILCSNGYLYGFGAGATDLWG